MTDTLPTREDIVIDALSRIEKVLPQFGATHAVVMIYNHDNGISDMFGTFTGARDIVRAAGILEKSAAEMRENMERQIQ